MNLPCDKRGRVGRYRFGHIAVLILSEAKPPILIRYANSIQMHTMWESKPTHWLYQNRAVAF